jgi:hypothetical protein
LAPRRAGPVGAGYWAIIHLHIVSEIRAEDFAMSAPASPLAGLTL